MIRQRRRKTMIKATFKKSNGSFIEYEVTGHAYFAEPGKDIVCAGVSTLFITITNQLICKSYVKMQGQQVSILNPNRIDNALVETLLCGLYDIQQKYPEHVSVVVIEKKTAKYAVQGFSETFLTKDEAIKFADLVLVSHSRVLKIVPPELQQSSSGMEN